MSSDDWDKESNDLGDEDFVAVNTGTVISNKIKPENQETIKASEEKISEDPKTSKDQNHPDSSEIANDAIKKAEEHSKHSTTPENKAQKEEEPKEPVKNVIIIKRVKKIVKGHHGGAWKIAYADFVTAMMTFFLLMWLLSMLNKSQLEGISKYFKTPLKARQTQTINPDDDKIKTEGEETSDKIMEPKPPEKTLDELDAKGRADSEKLKQDLVEQIKKNPKLSEYKNSLNFVVLSNGLKIEIKDLANKSMFSSGKTDFANYGKDVLAWLAEEINKHPNRIMIVGHTDSKPYPGPEGYTNWELSADRANATRRELIKNGMKTNKIVRISGMADTDKLDEAKNSEDPSNRRIAIIVLTDDAYKKMLEE